MEGNCAPDESLLLPELALEDLIVRGLFDETVSDEIPETNLLVDSSLDDANVTEVKLEDCLADRGPNKSEESEGSIAKDDCGLNLPVLLADREVNIETDESGNSADDCNK